MSIFRKRKRSSWRDQLKTHVRSNCNGKLKRKEIERQLAEAKEACKSGNSEDVLKAVVNGNHLMSSWLYSLDGRVGDWETMLGSFMDWMEDFVATHSGRTAGFWKAFGIITGAVLFLMTIWQYLIKPLLPG